MRRLVLWPSLAVTLLLIPPGCSETAEPGEQITASQAQAIWSSAEQALSAVQQKIVPDMQGADTGSGKGDALGDGGPDVLTDGGPDVLADGGSDKLPDGGSGWFSGTLASFTIDGTVTNPDGSGTAEIAGTGGKKTGGWGVTLTITFIQWEVNSEIVINGPLTVDYTISSLSPVAMTLTVTGTVMATIDKIPVPLPAAVDVLVTVAGSTTTVCGTVAGFEVGSGACP
jgi:hypothetical protein